MKRTEITLNTNSIPDKLYGYISDAKIFDSSCSPFAKVYFIDKGRGMFLKRAERGSLIREEAMTRYFSSLGLSSSVIEYFDDGQFDWLLTERIPGEDCTLAMYLSEPTRLCDLLAERLRMLHETDHTNCPVKSRMDEYFKTVDENYKKGLYDASYLLGNCKFGGISDTWYYIQKNKGELRCDTLLHGDYCLPNIILDNWKFSGFIDLGNGGVGDRHIDLYWGAWTLNFNLKTDRYRDRFFDAYGRDRVDSDKIQLISACEAFG